MDVNKMTNDKIFCRICKKEKNEKEVNMVKMGWSNVSTWMCNNCLRDKKLLNEIEINYTWYKEE